MVNGLLLILGIMSGTSATTIADENILEMNDEMRTFLLPFQAIQDPVKRLHRLVDAIFNEDFLNLQYDGSETKTAIETFQARNGNCLSFTTMFVAMARHIGLEARFQEVFNIPTWNRQGEMVVLNRHMNANVTITGRQFDVDFNPYQDRREFSKRVVSDLRAFAQYYNNLGAEAFGRGEIGHAFDFFEKAVEIDPSLSFAWSNLGVAYKYAGQFAKAEKAYFQALKVDKREYTAMANLARLYNEQGRKRDAEKFARKAEHYRDKNPYYHFTLAEQAYHLEQFEKARHHLKKAIRRKATDHEFYFALARVYAKLGKGERVAHALKKAKQYAPDVFNQNRYNQKLQMLADVD